jgi:hypothetical protein
MTKYIIASIIALSICSCTDASRARLTGYGDEYKVEMYSGGQMVRSWTSSGKVHSEEGSDGYFFNDKASGKLIEVTGDVVITQL